MTDNEHSRDTHVSVKKEPEASLAERATWREWLGLALMVLPMLTLASDLTVLFLALPTLSADLSPTASQGLWITHIYGFLIAGFLVTMGRLGDRIGPRRLLLIGATAFAAFSALAAFSANAEMLIAARALLGIAGATLMPSLFSLLRIMFRDDGQRRMAIAIMFSSFSAGGAVGPLLGGTLLEFFWWGSIFLINIPPLLLLILAAPRLLPERAERNAARLDFISVVLSVTGMLGIIYGLQELAAGQEADEGLAWPYLAIAAGGVLILSLFLRRQRRLRDPLFDLALLANRRIGVSLASLLLVGIAMVGMFFLVTQYLQWVVGLTPLQAGLWTLPYIVINIAGSMLAPLLAARIQPAAVVALGLGVTVGGAVLLALIAAPGVSLVAVISGLSVVGLGHGVAMALISDLIISNAPEDNTGSAAAAQEVGGELGSALGIAAAGAVSIAVYRASLSGAMPEEVSGTDADSALTSIHEGVITAQGLDSGGQELLSVVHDAVTSGLQAYAVAGALLAGAAGLLVTVILVVRGRAEKK